MLILLEGVDGAGKTHLANQLGLAIKRLHPNDEVHLMHKGPPTDHPLIEYENPLLGYRPGTGVHVICDRWHLGEVIYPKILNRSTQLDESVLWHIELFLKSRGALLVHVTAPLHVLRERLASDGDDLVDDSHLLPLRVAYDREVASTTLSWLRTTSDKAYSIIQRATSVEISHVALKPFVTYVGPRNPQMLLLGDVRNLKGLPPLTPAFVPLPSTCGHYLFESLLTVGSRRTFSGYLGVANACDVDDPMELWRTLGEPTVVTLGKHASDNTLLGREGWTANHPQFVRRFHYARQAEYAKQILNGEATPWRS